MSKTSGRKISKLMRSLKNTIVIKIDPERPDKRAIGYAAKIIREGGLVVFPTETVYGIAANRLDKQAMKNLAAVKKRPKGKPFTVHIADLSMIKKLNCAITGEAKALIDKFWPGPLTIVLKSKTGEKIGFRMPENLTALDLIKATGLPIVAPSANISGRRAPVTAEEVLKQLDGKIDILLDAGRTKMGIESTVVDLTVGPSKILREGAISHESLIRLHR